MGMEHDPNILSRQPDLRASDAERAQIIELLPRHHEAGRLTAYRINARGDRRYRRGDVERLLAEGADTPEITPPVTDDELRLQRAAVESTLAAFRWGRAAVPVG